MNSKRLWILALGTTMAGSVLAGCGGNGAEGGNTAGSEGNKAMSQAGGEGGATGGTMDTSQFASLSGSIKGDGSSTVFPITEAVAEEFGKVAPGVKATIGISGTGGGFKKFIAGDTFFQDASRPIKKAEDEKMKAAGREYIELPIAYDGLAVVVNPANTWATDLTVAELKKIWDKGSKINNWSQVRAGFPNKPIKLYGAGTDSGTFDYFTEAINGKEGQSRSDYTASEDDNTLVQGVSRDVNAMGYFGMAYYEENAKKLKLVKVNGVEPTVETVASSQYKPLSRPLFIYVERKSADLPEVKAFVDFFLSQEGELVKGVGYVPLPEATQAKVKARWAARTVGTMYTSDDAKKKALDQLLGS